MPLEGGPYFNDLRQGNFDAGVDFDCEFMDEPDLYLLKYLSSEKSPVNYARYKDVTLDELYERQSRMLDLKDRLPILRQMEKRVLAEQAYQFPLLWWQRIVPHSSRLKGWKIGPSHYVNQDLRDVWLAQ
jgi:peptide/nickel transport system substrate-binding protein